MRSRNIVSIAGALVMVLISTTWGNAQITAPGAAFTEQTQYPVFQQTDNIYIFCTDEGMNAGSLTVQTNLEGGKTFEWQRYNGQAAVFEFYFSESSAGNQSTISGLDDGCYRVTVKVGAESETYQAWVMNDWFSVTGSVGESNCEYFELNGSFTSARLVYYDLANNSEIQLSKDIRVKWEKGNEIVSLVNSPQITNPPPEDTDYKYTVFDRFGCESSVTVTYNSIVTEAGFTIDADFNGAGGGSGEAPLEVTFTNTSKNGDADGYEWFFFKDLDEIKKESENSDQPIDSIMDMAYNQNPVYTYENTGTYMVKLASKKVSEFHTCTDTFYLEDYIIVDSSFVSAPNVFTPNGDGINDNFIIKFWSMQQIKISLFNRWGKTVHVWEKSNIRRFEGSMEESVWDGKIGGRYASPGVYYYIVEGLGRDGEKRWAHGFFHVFRAKK